MGKKLKPYRFIFKKYYWESKFVKPSTFYLFSLSKEWVHEIGDTYLLDIFGFRIGFWWFNKKGKYWNTQKEGE